MKRLFLTGAVMLAGAISSLTAQSIAYVRDLSALGDGFQVLPLTQAPVDTSDPLYNSALADDSQIFGAITFLTPSRAYQIVAATGSVAAPTQLSGNMKLNPISLVTLAGVGTSEPLFEAIGSRNTLYRLNLATQQIVGPFEGVSVQLGTNTSINSLAAPNRNALTALGNSGFFFHRPRHG